jgi:nitrite reductase/ring-hydroxylating ferredoxin subunit/uncharacterized membrane protein
MKRDLTERAENSIVNSALVKKISEPLDAFLNRGFQTTVLRPLKLLLNGSWLGHPLHPLLTDVPIGAWTLTIILDLVGLLFKLPQLGVASAITALIGVAGAVAAMAAGLMDWMDVGPREKAVGAVHAILNTSATVLFAVSIFMRWSHHWQLTWEAFAVALAGLGCVMCGGYLGGGMVYHMGVMVNRNAYREGPDDFQPALAVADLAEGELKRVDVQGQPVLLVKSAGKIHAIGAVCSHYGAPLNEGKLAKNTVQCPWHLSRFDLEDGSVREGPACAAVPAYESRVLNDQVQIRLLR